MVKSAATTVAQYMEELPEDRRTAIETVRQTVLARLPDGYLETMLYGMISYVVPLDRFPNTYNKQPLALASLANQKNYMALYLNNVYSDPALEAHFTEGYRASGKRMDIGKSCVRFRKLGDLPLDVVGGAIASTSVEAMIERYLESRKLTVKGN